VSLISDRDDLFTARSSSGLSPSCILPRKTGEDEDEDEDEEED